MLLDTSTFDEVAAARGDFLVSVYMPTHRAGQEIRQDPIRLKNLLSETRERARERGVDPGRIDEALARPERLVDETVFWRNQGDGLGLLIDGEEMRTLRLPSSVEEFAEVGGRFNVRPLLPAVTTGERFHLLVLALNIVRLYDCSRSGYREVDLEDIPESLSETIGWDVEQKSLQFHTGAAPRGAETRAAVFHGQGSGGEEDTREEIKQFLLRVDKGLDGLIGSHDRPMVLAAEQRVGSMYQDVSKHARLSDEVIEGNPEHVSMDDLHERAVEIVTPTLDAERRDAMTLINSEAHPDRVAVGVGDVLDALIDARAGDVAVRKQPALWGRFHEHAGVEVSKQRTSEDEDLLDRLVHKALETGASVYAVEESDLPRESAAAALLRF